MTSPAPFGGAFVLAPLLQPAAALELRPSGTTTRNRGIAGRVTTTTEGPRLSSNPTISLTPAEARRLLVSHLGLTSCLGKGGRGVREVLERLRCIQIDPLDVIGTNADLVVMARIDGVGRGELWSHIFPGHAFEHFAKERCILPASSFPRYRDRGHAAGAKWWRHGEREQRLEKKLVDAVLAEIRERGPLSARELTDHGGVTPLDWGGWKGTSKATTMALEMLWTRCDIVVAGRTDSGAKLYDIPERALGPAASTEVAPDFGRWALRERALAAGLLSRSGGAHWSMLGDVRLSPVPDEMVARGELVEVTIEGSSRRYLAAPEFLAPRKIRYDGRVRILGPLDPLMWDRELVKAAFGFEYVWEVYKPAHQRKWGWYVCPLLHRDALAGRIDAKIDDGVLVVRKVWLEREIDKTLVREAVERHAEACGCQRVRMRL